MTVVNTDVLDGAQDTTIEVGTGGVTFDDFDSMEAAREEFVNAKTEEHKEQGQRSTEEKGIKGEQGESGPKDGKGSEEEEKSGDTKEEKKEDPEAKDGDKSKDPAKSKPKTYKVKSGEKETELTGDGHIKVKVGGKEEDITVQELINNYSGKTAWDKKFTELDVKDKESSAKIAQFESQFKQVESKFATLKELSQGEDKSKALDFILDLASINKYNFYEDLKQQMIPEVQKLSEMTEEELRMHKLEGKNRFLEQEKESNAKRIKEEQAKEALQSDLTAQREAHNLTDKEMTEAYDELVKRNVEGIDPGKIASAAVEIRSGNTVVRLLKEFDPELVNDDNVYYPLVDTIIANPNFTDEDIMAIITDTFGSKKDEDLVKSKLGNDEKKGRTQFDVKEKEGFVSFEDFEENYE